MFNKIGRTTDPCGTTLSNADRKLKLVLIFFLFQQLLGKLFVICKEFLSMPYAFIIFSYFDLISYRQ